MSAILIAIATAALLSLLIVPVAVRLGHRFNLLDLPVRHKRHKRPTPYTGGLALFAVFWLTIIVSTVMFDDAFGAYRDQLPWVFVASLLICIGGFLDDCYHLNEWKKLTIQIISAVILLAGGLKAQLLTTPSGSLELGWLAYPLTIAWVVMLTNAINIIDGLDGLATGVSLIAACFMLVIGSHHDIGAILVFVCALIGFLSVFWWHNKYPAKVFLGDSGSMQIGFLFAVISLGHPLKSFTASALYLPMLALGVPILETVSSTIRRVSAGKSPMKADRRHLFHYLALAGLTPRQVVSVFYGLGLIFGGVSLAMLYWNRLILLGILSVFMLIVFGVFFVLISMTLTRRRPDSGSDRPPGSRRTGRK
ncbi:MAG: MraY family glycosyltransferase [Candidatus Zixiibacteriota bacterium]